MEIQNISRKIIAGTGEPWTVQFEKVPNSAHLTKLKDWILDISKNIMQSYFTIKKISESEMVRRMQAAEIPVEGFLTKEQWCVIEDTTTKRVWFGTYDKNGIDLKLVASDKVLYASSNYGCGEEVLVTRPNTPQ